LKFQDDEEDEEEKVEVKQQEVFGRSKRGSTAVLENKLRSEHSSEEKRKQHQRELALSLNEKAQERLAKQSSGKETEKIRKSTVSYKSVNQMPRESEVKELKLFVGMIWNSCI
jgi:nucleosome binding factor SPN SPT16 subunit